MPDKDNFIVTGNSTSANNTFTGVSSGRNNTSSNTPSYGRVISVNSKDRTITYEVVKTDLGTSAINSKSKVTGIAYNYNPQFTRLPIIGEIVPLVLGPTENVGDASNQNDKKVYYQSPIAVQNTVNNNKAPQEIQKSTQSLNNNYKLNDVGIKTTPNPPKGNRVGTDVDGINGQYTSQFKFPEKVFQKLTLEFVGKPVQVINTILGLEANDTLGSIAKSLNFTNQQMIDWNTFVDWMGTNKYKGSTDMNSKPYSKKVWSEYVTIVKKDFWVKYIKPDLTSDDVARVQNALKVYRAYLINEWKKGSPNSPRITLPTSDPKIKFNKDDDKTWANPSIPEDIKIVNERFMWWAKPPQYN